MADSESLTDTVLGTRAKRAVTWGRQRDDHAEAAVDAMRCAVADAVNARGAEVLSRSLWHYLQDARLRFPIGLVKRVLACEDGRWTGVGMRVVFAKAAVMAGLHDAMIKWRDGLSGDDAGQIGLEWLGDGGPGDVKERICEGGSQDEDEEVEQVFTVRNFQGRNYLKKLVAVMRKGDGNDSAARADASTMLQKIENGVDVGSIAREMDRLGKALRRKRGAEEVLDGRRRVRKRGDVDDPLSQHAGPSAASPQVLRNNGEPSVRSNGDEPLRAQSNSAAHQKARKAAVAGKKKFLAVDHMDEAAFPGSSDEESEGSGSDGENGKAESPPRKETLQEMYERRVTRPNSPAKKAKHVKPRGDLSGAKDVNDEAGTRKDRREGGKYVQGRKEKDNDDEIQGTFSNGSGAAGMNAGGADPPQPSPSKSPRGSVKKNRSAYHLASEGKSASPISPESEFTPGSDVDGLTAKRRRLARRRRLSTELSPIPLESPAQKEKKAGAAGSGGKRINWADYEDEALIQGLKRHGWGEWKLVLEDEQNESLFHPSRTNVKLKDRARVLQLDRESFPASRGAPRSGRPAKYTPTKKRFGRVIMSSTSGSTTNSQSSPSA